MLRLNPQAARVVGVKLAAGLITVAVTDFCADVVATSATPLPVDPRSSSTTAGLVESGVRNCVRSANLSMADISGVCVGLPGVVERASGVCRQSPIFIDRDAPFAAELTRRLGAPASIDSDVNMAALAEHWFGQARDLNDFLVVSIERDLGLGILHNGELFRGANGLSPDFGDIWAGAPGESGRRLSEIASEAAMLRAGQAVLGPEPARSSADTLSREGRDLSLLLERAKAGDRRCRDIVEEGGRAMGMAIANLITLFAPPKVIVSGRSLATHSAFLEPLRIAVAEFLPASLAGVCEIVTREWSDPIWVRGAAAMTLRDLYGAPWGATGPALSAVERVP